MYAPDCGRACWCAACPAPRRACDPAHPARYRPAWAPARRRARRWPSAPSVATATRRRRRAGSAAAPRPGGSPTRRAVARCRPRSADPRTRSAAWPPARRSRARTSGRRRASSAWPSSSRPRSAPCHIVRDADFHAPVLAPAVLGGIVADRLGVAIAVGAQPRRVLQPGRGQCPTHRRRPCLAQLEVGGERQGCGSAGCRYAPRSGSGRG